VGAPGDREHIDGYRHKGMILDVKQFFQIHTCNTRALEEQ